MGREKIEIKRLEPASHRNSTFGIRFKGLCKKAEELSVLCDVPVMLVVSEPNDRQKLCLNGNRSFEQIVQQFAYESKESPDKENKHCIKVLERAYKKDDHVVDVRSLMHNGVRQAKVDETFELKKQLEMIEDEMAKIEDHLSPLRCVGGLEKINAIDLLESFEKSLTKLFSLNERKKALLLEIHKNCYHHLPTPSEGDHPVSTSPLVQQTDGLSEVLRTEQQNTMCHVPLHYEGDPRCSISTVAAPEVPTAPLRSNHIAPLYDWNMTQTANVTVWASSFNPQNGYLPEEEYPQNGGLPEEAGSEYPQNGDLREEAGSEEYPQNGDLPDEAGSEYLQNGDLPEEAGSEYPQNGYLPVEAGSEYPQNGYLPVKAGSEEYPQNGDLPEEAGSEEYPQNGDLPEEAGSEEYPQNGDLPEEAGSEYPQNGDLPEEVGSEEYLQNGDLPEEVGSEEYMQRKYDEEISSTVNLHLQSPTPEDYTLFF